MGAGRRARAAEEAEVDVVVVLKLMLCVIAAVGGKAVQADDDDDADDADEEKGKEESAVDRGRVFALEREERVGLDDEVENLVELSCVVDLEGGGVVRSGALRCAARARKGATAWVMFAFVVAAMEEVDLGANNKVENDELVEEEDGKELMEVLGNAWLEVEVSERNKLVAKLRLAIFGGKGKCGVFERILSLLCELSAQSN